MTDAEIIKALECCSTDRDCTQCPSQNYYPFCGEILSGFALDLINRQQAEIARWESLYKPDATTEEILKKYSNFVVKEFAERLKDNTSEIVIGGVYKYKVITIQGIDHILKEFIEMYRKEQNNETENKT